MRFPLLFRRFKTAVPPGKIALGGDAVPAGPPDFKDSDNILFSRFNNINGWPVHRIVMACKAPPGAPPLPVTMYFFEDATQTWQQIGGSTLLTPGTVAFFDTVALLDLPHTRSSQAGQALEEAPTSGSIAQLIIVGDPGGTPAGEYDFAAGPDLTTFP